MNQSNCSKSLIKKNPNARFENKIAAENVFSQGNMNVESVIGGFTTATAFWHKTRYASAIEQ